MSRRISGVCLKNLANKLGVRFFSGHDIRDDAYWGENFKHVSDRSLSSCYQDLLFIGKRMGFDDEYLLG